MLLTLQFPNRLSEHLQTLNDSPTLKYSPLCLFQQDQLNSGRGTVLRLERLCDKQALTHMPTPISWDCLECCVEKDSEAALGLSGNED